MMTHRMPHDNRTRQWSDEAATIGMKSIAGNHWKLGRGEEEFFSRAFREYMTV